MNVRMSDKILWNSRLLESCLLHSRIFNGKVFFSAIFALLLAIPAFAHDKKKHPDRAMIEKMEAVPCGAKERGLTGLGSVFGSVGVTHVNSDEKLCPQYLLRTDEMEYHVRPLDKKHPAILPVGKEAEFKLTKDKLDMRIPDGDRKMRHYQVVGITPIEHPNAATSYNSMDDKPRNNYADKPLADKQYDGQYGNQNAIVPLNQAGTRPQ
jgi:hypothetical protein